MKLWIHRKNRCFSFPRVPTDVLGVVRGGVPPGPCRKIPNCKGGEWIGVPLTTVRRRRSRVVRAWAPDPLPHVGKPLNPNPWPFSSTREKDGANPLLRVCVQGGGGICSASTGTVSALYSRPTLRERGEWTEDPDHWNTGFGGGVNPRPPPPGTALGPPASPPCWRARVSSPSTPSPSRPHTASQRSRTPRPLASCWTPRCIIHMVPCCAGVGGGGLVCQIQPAV